MENRDVRRCTVSKKQPGATLTLLPAVCMGIDADYRLIVAGYIIYR
jgi:hypothetical protein